MEGQEKGLREIAQGMEKTLGRMEVTLDRISLSLLASQRSEKEKFWEARMSQGDVLIRECLRMGMDAKKIMKDIHNTLIPMYCALL